jgi:putative transposase
MPRRPRRATGGFVFHVMNRGARRLPLFETDDDYRLFLTTLRESQARVPLRLLSYVLMPNHWHLVVWPEHDEELSQFMAWATGTHARRWHRRHGTVGMGTIYQGRYKAIPVKDDFHFLIVCRYVERNPIVAGLVRRSADWPWSSAARRHGSAPVLSTWPVTAPERWREHVDAVQAPGEFDELRNGIRHVRPFGPSTWQRSVARRLEWPLGLRPRGRPTK